jgi:hypothetical protein
VKQVFAARGVQLATVSHVGTSRHGVVVLSTRQGKTATRSSFTVSVFGTRDVVHLGQSSAAFAAQVGNVQISYGGPKSNREFLGRVRQAVNDLKN